MALRQRRKGRRRAIKNNLIPRPRGRRGRKTMKGRIVPFMLVARATGVVMETITLKGLTGQVAVTARY